MSSYLDFVKSSNSQESGVSDDTQFTIVKGPATSAPVALSTLLNIPPALPAVCQRVFDLKDSITWSKEESAEFWPFINNIWVHNQTLL